MGHLRIINQPQQPTTAAMTQLEIPTPARDEVIVIGTTEIPIRSLPSQTLPLQVAGWIIILENVDPHFT